jgi:hypothetical protein
MRGAGYDRRNMTCVRFAMLCALSLTTVVGCAAPRAIPPPRWPATFSGRELFYTQSILVYARDGSAADHAADRFARVGREFQSRTGAPPTYGLVIVDGMEESKIGDLDPVALLPAEEKKDTHHNLEIPLQDIALVLTLPIEKQKLSRQAGFTSAPLGTVQWCAATPSEDRMDRFISSIIDAGIKAQHFNFAQRILILPFLPLFHSLIGDALNAEEDTLCYQCLCNAEPGWDEQRRKKEIEGYEAYRMGEAVKSLKAATQQVTKDTDR